MRRHWRSRSKRAGEGANVRQAGMGRVSKLKVAVQVFTKSQDLFRIILRIVKLQNKFKSTKKKKTLEGFSGISVM